MEPIRIKAKGGSGVGGSMTLTLEDGLITLHLQSREVAVTYPKSPNILAKRTFLGVVESFFDDTLNIRFYFERYEGEGDPEGDLSKIIYRDGWCDASYGDAPISELRACSPTEIMELNALRYPKKSEPANASFVQAGLPSLGKRR